MKNKANIIKRLIIALICILFVVITIILFLNMQKKDQDNVQNEIEYDDDNGINSIENDNIISNTLNETDNNIQIKYSHKLEPVYDMNTYFLIKQCMEIYYDSIAIDDVQTLIDEDVTEKMNINDIESIKNTDLPAFSIDNIYKQRLSSNLNIYVIYYRVEKNSTNSLNSTIWIKVNDKDKDFSIYPYEYLKLNNYLNLKENDTINISTTKNINKDKKNTYNDDISYGTKDCMNELFKRYKFDLVLDLEHLYNSLNEEYKNIKFPTFEEFQSFVNENENDLYLDSINTYNVTDYGQSIEYKGTGGTNRTYVFNIINLMDYRLSFDDYEIVQSEEFYDKFLPQAKARYCIDRIVKAINNNDYEFIYSKLNPIQKNNYFENIDELESFIEEKFYEENSYEINEEYLIISDDVYQFDVKMTDKTGNSNSARNYTMTVTLKENADFTISIVLK